MTLTRNQFEDAAKKMFQRATKAIPSNWRSTFTSLSSLHSMLVRLQGENESTTVHVLVKTVSEEQIDEALSKLPFRRMTRVWMEIDEAIITIIPAQNMRSLARLFLEILRLLLKEFQDIIYSRLLTYAPPGSIILVKGVKKGTAD